MVGDAPPRTWQSWVRAGFGEAGLATDGFWGWGQHTSPLHPPGPTAGTEPGTGGARTVSSPEAPRLPARGGTGKARPRRRERSRAEPGDSRPMAFPGRGAGDVGENKNGFLCWGRRAGQAEQDGAGQELSTHSHPILSRPIPSPGTTCWEGRMLGCQVGGSFSLPHWDSLQEWDRLWGSTGWRLGGLVGPHHADGAQ